MNISLRIVLMVFFVSVLSGTSGAQTGYHDHKSMVREAEALGRQFPALCTVKSLVKTAGGRDIMILTIGTGEKDSKPGIAVIGGIEGNYILGRELALGFAGKLLKGASSHENISLLEKISFYVLPDVSPDASEQYFQGLKYERTVNARPMDDDRDFVTDEDPCEDLNNDGMITMIRVADPTGNYVVSSENDRIMVEADPAKGERGSYLLFTEGIDNDKDGKFNEDGPGGVNFNRNLTYNYEEFGTGSGSHPVSEPETKAVLDFLFDHYNIYATFAFGPQDNLGQQPRPGPERSGGAPAAGAGQGSGQDQRPPQASSFPPPGGSFPMQGAPGSGSMRMMMGQDRRITSVLKADETIVKLAANKYREITAVKGSPPAKSSPGNFMDWSYYHYGRYSFSTPAWWIPAERDKNPDVTFLKFAEENKIDGVFVPWTEISHPDFPGKKVEAGGIRPFASVNPTADKLSKLITNNSKFITEMARMHPQLELVDVVTEDQGENIYRLSLKVLNSGIFATCSAAGERNLWTRIMRISLETGSNQKLLSGQKVQRIQRLEGGGSAEFSWLIMGKGKVKISAGAANTGTVTTTAELK